MTLQLLPSEFPYTLYEENFFIIFYQWSLSTFFSNKKGNLSYMTLHPTSSINSNRRISLIVLYQEAVTFAWSRKWRDLSWRWRRTASASSSGGWRTRTRASTLVRYHSWWGEQPQPRHQEAGGPGQGPLHLSGISLMIWAGGGGKQPQPRHQEAGGPGQGPLHLSGISHDMSWRWRKTASASSSGGWRTRTRASTHVRYHSWCELEVEENSLSLVIRRLEDQDKGL